MTPDDNVYTMLIWTVQYVKKNLKPIFTKQVKLV